MFLRNCWYVAGWGADFGRQLSARTILGDEIVIFRRTNGSAVALENACPHRKLPLSEGALRGDTVECGYHGLTFDCSGACVAAPTQPDNIPRRARVRSYPVVERYRLLWIWMGDPDLADPEKIVEIEEFDNPEWGQTDGGTIDIDCNYLWVCDNLLDPSHVAWVHVSSFAGAGTDSEPLTVTRRENGVLVHRWIMGTNPSPYYAPLLKFKGACDRLQHYEMIYPGIGINKSVYTPAGTGGDGSKAVALTYINISYNYMTPIDADRTRYFWFQHRNTDATDKAISEKMNAGARIAFEEDRAVLEKVHWGMKHKASPSLDLGLDAGAKLFRLGMEKLIAAERAQTTEVQDGALP